MVRDPKKYEGIIDSALSGAEVPFFFSKKSDLCSMPAIKLILSALRIKRYNWQASDLLSHLKTGLCDIDMHDAYLFEEYSQTMPFQKAAKKERVTFENPENAIKELARVTKKGGRLILPTFLVNDKMPMIKLYKLLGYNQRTSFTVDSYLDLLENAEIGDIHLKVIDGVIPVGYAVINKKKEAI